jgi:hypothetical protein
MIMEKVFPEQPILDAGIRSVNFFNGRLLTAEDLTAEQTANLQARRLTGQALGSGVAAGFTVSLAGKAEDFTVNVEAGLAVNRRGDVLQLANPAVVSLTGSVKNPGDQVATVFSDCTNTPSGQFTPTGLYVLTISPASAGEGRAPTSGLGNSAAPCNTRFVVQGVTFHLIRLSTPAINNQLRNILAYQSFGFLPLNTPLTSSTSPLTTALEAPFNTQPDEYGLLDALTPDKYPTCHVPLALIFTTSGRVDFIDNWAVRRHVTQLTTTQPWQVYESPRRRSEMEAAFLQFQDHLADLITAKQVTALSAASSYFKLLPPVGILPTQASSCDWHTFLGVHAPAYETRLDSGLLTSLLEEALTCSPFVVEDTTRPPAAVDVFSIPVSNTLFVKAIDENLASQLEQVDHDTIFRLLNLTQQDPGFVLYARSQRGRIRLFFTPHNFQNSNAFFDAASTESNLDVQGSSAASGDIVFPDLEHGFYLVRGNIQGFKPISPYVAKVNPGQVTKIQISPVALTLKLCLVRESIPKLELSNVRFCLVEGTFEAAILFSKDKPWANFTALEIGDLATQKQLKDWQDVFAERFPDNGIENSDPQIFVGEAVTNLPAGTVSDKTSIGSGMGIPESPWAYVVFGSIGFPMTFVANTNIKRDPVPLTESLRGIEIGIGRPGAAVSAQLVKKMIKYGIVFVEQAAGGWLELIMDATGVTRSQAALIIQTYARLLAEIDKGA